MGPRRDDSEKAPVGSAMPVQYSSTWGMRAQVSQVYLDCRQEETFPGVASKSKFLGRD